MQISKLIFAPALLLLVALMVALTSGVVDAQSYAIQTSAPIYQQPVYLSSPPAGSQLKTNAGWDKCDCQCPQPGNGPCDCKNLNCKIKLPAGCKNTTGPTKTPIACKIYGKIPVFNYNQNCLEQCCDFRYLTEVPEVHCVCEQCVEIGKKMIQCLPGCCFSVCVPVNKCQTKTVQCKLGQKEMPMQLWKRTQGTQIVYDVYVINSPNRDSPDHAGGMPDKWVIMHCGTEADFNARFPGAVCTDGTPALGAKATPKNAKPQSTTADVELKLVVDQEELANYIKQDANEEESKIESDSTATTSEAEKPQPFGNLEVQSSNPGSSS